MKTEITIVEGMILVCDTLLWDGGWEFDRPTMMLAPVVRCYETGASHDQIVEDVMLDAVTEPTLKSQDFKQLWGWRGYKLPVLRRRFREALAGKRFPIAGYNARRQTVRIVLGQEGELAWEIVN